MKKKQLKQRIDYVDEFRKMNALEKLPIINDKFQNMFEEDSTAEANNFMRIRNEPNIQKWDNSEDHQALLLNNQHIHQRTINHFQEQKQSYNNENTRVRDHFNMFKQWSQENKNTRNKKQRFKFFYKEASPPKKVSTEKKEKKQMPSSLLQNPNIGSNEASTLQILNAVVSGKQFKYDFKLINQKREDEILQMPENKNNNQQKQDSLLIQAFKKFSSYKNLEEINSMDENKISEQQFMYDLANIEEENPKLEDYLLNKFIYKSVTKYYKNTEKDVEYFRDLGLPSRDLQKFTEMFTMGKDSLQDETKQQSHHLHLLRECQLNINKSDINFDDISNISNGRVTSLNAYMCIRSQKVTKAQYEKLIKKLDKYKKQQMQKGKEKVQIGICTQDMDMQDQSGKRQILNEEKNQIANLIQQIGDIRQSVNLMKQKKQTKNISINEVNFKKQKYTRMQVLLKMLYEKIVTDPIKYPFSLLEDNIHHFDQMLEDQHKDGKLLWFILDCFEEISSDQQEEDNIKNILKKKPIEEPKLTFYKGKKVMKEEKLKVTNLYTYKEKPNEKQIPTNDRSNVKTRKSITPPKEVTPRKTATKKPIYKEASFTKNK